MLSMKRRDKMPKKNKIYLFIVFIVLIVISFWYCYWIGLYWHRYSVYLYLSLFILQGSISYFMIKLILKSNQKKAVLLGSILSCVYFILIRRISFFCLTYTVDSCIETEKTPNIFFITILHILFCIIFIFIWNQLKKRNYIE